VDSKKWYGNNNVPSDFSFSVIEVTSNAYDLF